MSQKLRRFIDWIKLIFSVLMVVYASTAASMNAAEKSSTVIPVIVLDVQLLGDTKIESMQKGDAELMTKLSKVLRQQLNQ